MKNDNSSGLFSTAVASFLVCVLVIALFGSYALLMDSTNINQNEYYETIAKKTSSSLADSSLNSIQSIDSSSSEDSSLVEIDLYPAKSSDYKAVTDKEFTAENAILVDADSDEIIAGKNYDKKIYPASLTKLMTVLVAVDELDDLNKTYTFKSEIVDPLVDENASRVGFEAGEKVTAKDLLCASMLESGADGTGGLADMIAGSEKEFVNLMNEKVAELGLKNTHFSNASGLFDKNNYSTAEDIAVIMNEVRNNDTLNEIIGLKTYTSSKTAQHKNGIKMNSIVFSRLNGYFVEGGGEITGGKTGFIDESKYSMASVYENNGRTFICVTSKSSTEFKSVEDSIMLYEKYAVPKSKIAAAADSDSTESLSSSDSSSDDSTADEFSNNVVIANSAPARERIS
ncbi:MAG: D-alanyl-D-alanine carboxypeptidase family protein [Oscillospiraceae bacterium]